MSLLVDHTNLLTGKKRIEFIDLIKGVCCILVIFEHCHVICSNQYGRECILMPAFFFISGLFFKESEGCLNMLRKKTNQLIVPYLFFYVYAVVFVWCGVRIFGLEHLHFNISFHSFLNGFPYPNLPLWFLRCLIINYFSLFLIHKCVRNKLIQGTFAMLIGLAGLYCAIWDIALPFSMASAMTCFPYFWIGFAMKRSKVIHSGARNKYSLVIGVLLLVIGVWLYDYLGSPRIIYWSNGLAGDWYWCNLITAIMLPGLILVCKYINRIPLLTYVGRYSLIVYGVHYIMVQVLKTILEPWYIFIVVTIISIVLIPVFKALFPWFIGQKELLKPMSDYRVSLNKI